MWKETRLLLKLTLPGRLNSTPRSGICNNLISHKLSYFLTSKLRLRHLVSCSLAARGQVRVGGCKVRLGNRVDRVGCKVKLGNRVDRVGGRSIRLGNRVDRVGCYKVRLGNIMDRVRL